MFEPSYRRIDVRLHRIRPHRRASPSCTDAARLAIRAASSHRSELALTPPTRARRWQLSRRRPKTVRFLDDTRRASPLRAAAELPAALEALARGPPARAAPAAGRSPTSSIRSSRRARRSAARRAPFLSSTRSSAASPRFKTEIAAVRHAIEPIGRGARSRPARRCAASATGCARSGSGCAATLEQFVRGKDTAKYLQDEVVTERNGRYVLMVRAEHRGNVPGIVHGSSASGATLFLEPSATVEINNDIVELEEREREEIFRILLELTDASAPGRGSSRTSGVATELDVLQAKARASARRSRASSRQQRRALELRAARHPLLLREVGAGSRIRLTQRGPGAESSGRHPAGPPTRVLLITGPQYRRQDGGDQDRGAARVDGAGRPARAGRSGAAAGVPVGVRRHRRRAVDRRQPEHVLGAHHQHRRDGSRARAPALVLLDEVGTGTDPNEGGALATAIVNHFKQRGRAGDRDDALRRGEDLGAGDRRRGDGRVRLRSRRRSRRPTR